MAKCIRCKQDKPITVLSPTYPLCEECSKQLDKENICTNPAKTGCEFKVKDSVICTYLKKCQWKRY